MKKIKKPIIILLILIIVLFSCGSVSAVHDSGPIGIGTNTSYVDNNTKIGNHIFVTLLYETTDANIASLNFTKVDLQGNTTIEEINSSSVPETPSQFAVNSSSVFYEIKTTATYSGPIQISLNYSEMNYDDESSLRLLHFNNNTGVWEDCTTSIDTVNKIIYGLVNSLSPFTILEKIDSNSNTNQNNYNPTNTVNPKISNNPKNNSPIVNAASKETAIGMQKTGLPITGLILAVLALFGGLASSKRK